MYGCLAYAELRRQTILRETFAGRKVSLGDSIPDGQVSMLGP
jgi:hypothetical protein